MKLLPTLALLCTIFSNSSFAQDSLVRFDDLTFSSAIEKKAFEDLFVNNQPDLFALAMANGRSLNENAINNARDRFYTHVNSTYSAKFQTKKNDKKIKQVFDGIHNAFFSKYEFKNRFEDIFSAGNYNCVSGSMLYALAFQKLGIPFHIVEKPTHVYLIAYPEQDRIVVEPTAPTMGYFIPSEQFKINYVKVLKDQKVISNQEYVGSDLNTLFEKHYFGDFKNIDVLRLIGLQYMNDGLYTMEEGKHLEALHQFEKAYMLYPSDRVGYLLMLSAHNAFGTLDAGSEMHALVLAKLSRYKKFGITSEMIQGELARVIQKLLFEKNQKAEMEAYYNSLTSHVADTSLLTDLAFIYYYEFGRMLHNQSEYKASIPYVEQMLDVKPSNQDGISLFLSCVFRSLRNENNQSIINKLTVYGSRYSFLKDNISFNGLLATAYLLEFDRAFQQNNPTEGEKYRMLFESIARKYDDLEIDDYMIANAYSSAAVYYFRKGQNGKAKGVVTSGLEISPENYTLLERKRMLK